MSAGIHRPREAFRGFSAAANLGLFSGEAGVWDEVSGYYKHC